MTDSDVYQSDGLKEEALFVSGFFRDPQQVVCIRETMMHAA